MPGLERVDYLNLIPVSLETKKACTREGVAVTVQAVANVKIGSDEASLRMSAERFLGMPLEGVKEVILQTLEAHLRAICGTLSVEEINSDRQAFAQRMTAEAAEDFRKMAFVIDVFAVQHIQDEHGYLDSLGRKRTAEVVRDAEIGEADATRDSMTRVAVATREAERMRKELDGTMVAEAEAMLRKAEALKSYGEAARMQRVVERLPEIAQAFADPMRSIDKVSIIELGGGNGSSSGVQRFVGNVGGGMVALSEFLKQSFDIDLAQLIHSKRGGDAGPGDGAKASPASETPPTAGAKK